jgi:nicotinamidase-related amidase
MNNGNPTPSILTPADRRGINAEAHNESESHRHAETHALNDSAGTEQFFRHLIRDKLGASAEAASAGPSDTGTQASGNSAAGASSTSAQDPYADPVKPYLPQITMSLDLSRTALVIIDPQVDFLSPKGMAWEAFGASITEHNTVANITRLLQAAKTAGIPVAISPHYYYPYDSEWKYGGAGETAMHHGWFARKDPLSVDGFENSGADWMPEYKPFIEDGKTVVCSPHKVFGPQANDLELQLRKRRVDQIVLAGMSANLCVESHLRELVERGFEVAVVRDATAGGKIPEGDGYLAALVNYRWLANALWTTDEAVKRLTKA